MCSAGQDTPVAVIARFLQAWQDSLGKNITIILGNLPVGSVTVHVRVIEPEAVTVRKHKIIKAMLFRYVFVPSKILISVSQIHSSSHSVLGLVLGVVLAAVALLLLGASQNRMRQK